ncbi:MAG: hypothetical protein HWN66_01795 [Candidatus Helarchaeota archaeon]|nr:hypothetical protein [Candidatus Helarchaeota archaeon]
MCKKASFEDDRIELAQYCEKYFRQKTNLPQTFIDASYEDLTKFLKRQGKHVEDVFLEIFLENTPDLTDPEK